MTSGVLPTSKTRPASGRRSLHLAVSSEPPVVVPSDTGGSLRLARSQ